MRNFENTSKTNGFREDDDQKIKSSTLGRLNRSFSGHTEPNSTRATYSSYNDFLKNYGSKKFNPVRADFDRKDVEGEGEANGKKPTVKSELFIHVNDNGPTVNGNVNSDVTDFVGIRRNVKKLEAAAFIPQPPPKSSAHLPKFKPKPNQHYTQIQKLTNAQQDETKPDDFQNFSHNRQVSPNPKSPEIVPDDMIYAKTAMLSELMSKTFPIGGDQSDEMRTTTTPEKLQKHQPPVVPNGIPAPPKLPDFPLIQAKPKHLTKSDHKLTIKEKNVGQNGQKPLVLPTPDCKVVPPMPPKFLMQQPPLSIEANTTTIVPVVDSAANVNKSDPNVKKLVYNTYRGFLGAYNNKANDMVATLPRNMVFKDQGVGKQVESMAAQGPTGPPGVGRHKSDVSDRRVEPPLCVQNAMLTKDKKPFTYTPGGIDLSEIRSPRMARRIERNANSPGVAEVVITSPYQGSAGPLPPSALAAMQSAMPVQVFPSGPPPPPPPPSAPVPPPPPMGPLPTITVATNEGVFERPDMTKIIPENPMALLRKTSGVNRRSFVDETDYSQGRPQNVEYDVAPRPQFGQAQSQMQPRPPQTTQFPSQAKPQPQMVSQPQHLPNSAPNQNSQAEVKTSTAQLGSLYIPPLGSNGTQASSSPPAPPQRKVQSPDSSPDSPQSPIPVLNKAPRPWQNQKPAQQELPPWAQRSQSPPRQQSLPAQTQQQLPSPPIQQQQQQQQQRQVPSSPAPQQQQQQRQIPTSPVYQQQQQQQRQVPTSPVQQQPRLNQQIRPPQQQQQPTIVGRVIIPVQMDASPSQNSNKGVDAVFVTQPVVLQHPGARPEGKQQQSQQQQQRPVQPQAKQQQQVPTEKGTRIIPIQIEGGGASNSNVQRQDSKLSGPGTAPATPGSARTFNRQPSWSSTPTQSNSFKVIQKITNTDGEEDEDQVTIEHSPKSSQHFNQGQADQARKLKLSEGDRELMNKFKQGVDEENSVHKEVDPRYRGAAIPSRAFRYLQSMTDGSDDQPAVPSASVPRSPQGGGIGANRGPQVRTIPVQIEGDSSGKPYVPPSEQTVQEPKKYTGSAIPSRSFKMLQAMTGDKCGPDQSDL